MIASVNIYELIGGSTFNFSYILHISNLLSDNILHILYMYSQHKELMYAKESLMLRICIFFASIYNTFNINMILCSSVSININELQNRRGGKAIILK